MGTTLTGTTPQDTYDSLIKVTDNGPLSATAKYLSDGLGNDSVLALSTSLAGVGKIPAARKLEVQQVLGGNAAAVGLFDGSGTLNSVVGLEPSANDFQVATTAGIRFYTGSTIGNIVTEPTNERMRITSTGNVGIGTSAPAVRLDVSSAGFEVAAFRSTFGQMAISFANSGTTFAQMGSGISVAATGGAADLGFGTAGQANASIIFATGAGYLERCRITNNGVTFNGDTAAANALDDYEEGTWTPSDGSGGGLTYAQVSGTYTKIGREVFVRGFVQFPATADGNQAIVTGLPFTTSASLGGREGNISYVDKTAISYILSNTSASTFSCWSSAGTSVTNAQMSGAFFYFSLNYNV